MIKKGVVKKGSKKDIDHVCHISRFVFDNEAGNFEAKVFEAGIERGMEENTLMDKLEHFKGKVYIEELKDADREIKNGH